MNSENNKNDAGEQNSGIKSTNGNRSRNKKVASDGGVQSQSTSQQSDRGDLVATQDPNQTVATKNITENPDSNGSRNLVDSIVINSSFVNDNLDNFKKDNPDMRLVEVNHQPKRYDNGHIPGAIKIDWETEVSEKSGQDMFDRNAFESAMADHGITEDTTLVIYGDEGNWFAAHAFWVCRYFGHENVHMMEGGRRHWKQEGFEFTKVEPTVTSTTYTANEPNKALKQYVIRSHP
jgi:hypothetical protein